ncbi:hypothetical protein B0H16DRAFT_1593009 [Mycena metata]|uniref:Phospholipase D/nuclease n=1 Tax=Mycena metata TaxID=1033252 RepID=A0AAD7HR14_9AGAR|nr:hypothetical protein B0H16DRAFT_1593009 [Mycena metata]
MERERLARQKRVRPPSPVAARPASSDDEYDEDEEEGSEGSARKRARLDSRGAASGGGNARGGNKGASGSGSGSTPDGRRLFPQGAILRVDTQHARVHSVPLVGSSASTSTSTTSTSTSNTLGGGSSTNAKRKNNGEKTQAPAAAIPECIRLSALLGPPASIAFAIVSAYVLDAPWLYGFFDRATPVMVVGHGEGEGGESGPTLKNILPTWTRVCPPLYDGRGCMHVKLLLLFYKGENTLGGGGGDKGGGGRGWIRVVIGSANLVAGDWRDVENYVFVQDIPPASPNSKQPTTRARTKEKPGESFPAMLARTLRALGVEEALAIMGKQGHESLPLPTLLPPNPKDKSPLETNWDWTQVRAALVPSIAGRSMGWAGEKAVVWNAQPRLLRAVLALGCALDEGVAIGVSDPNPEAKRRSIASKRKPKTQSPTRKAKGKVEKWELELDCLTSSIGTYTAPWVQAFRLCAAGRVEGLQAWLDRGRKKTPQQGPTHVLFPTLETVRGTTLGEGGAGTVFCRRGQWDKIRTLDDRAGLEMRDAKSRSGPVGMHTKMILATLRGPPQDDTDPEATDSDTDPDATDPDSSDVEVVEIKPKRTEADEEEKRKPHGWIYVGSHNFTPSAWGSMTGSGFSPVLTVTNYELGVILRLETEEDAAAAIAWEHPARAYGPKDTPWIQDESPFFMP